MPGWRNRSALRYHQLLRQGAIVTNDALDAFAAAHAADATAVRNLIASLRDHAGTDHFYVFWSPTRGAADKSSSAPIRPTS